MGSKIIGHLKELWSYIHTLMESIENKNAGDLMKLDIYLLEEIATTQTELLSKIIVLSQQLGNVGKTSKSIRQQCRLDNCSKDADANVDEDEEFLQKRESKSPNAVEDETAESFRELPVEPSKERKHFRVLMDVSDFSPKEVNVKVLEKYLVIHAKHEILADAHGTISREFTRKFELSEDVDTETLRALVDCYGVLTVEASLRPMNIEDKTLVMLVDTYCETNSQPYEDLGRQFHELAKHQIKDGMDMKEFARNIAKQRPSDYIPLEEVI